MGLCFPNIKCSKINKHKNSDQNSILCYSFSTGVIKLCLRFVINTHNWINILP